MSRHAWAKIALHHYRCTRCGMDKHNALLDEPTAAGWAQWQARFSRAGEQWVGSTPPCPGVLPAPAAPALEWVRIDRYVERAQSGERVCAHPDPRGWRFIAWGADVAPGVKYYDWPPEPTVHYRRGQSVPQRCALLGVFATAEEARAACARDAAGRAARAADGQMTTLDASGQRANAAD